MLKKRIAATLLVKDGICVQSIGFQRYLPLGKPHIAIEFLNDWGVDEIILLDLSASKAGRAPDFTMIRHAAAHSRVPLTVGGGIHELEHIKILLQSGADKIACNNAAQRNPHLLSEAAERYGDQCVVAAIDACATRQGYRVYDYTRRAITDKNPGQFARELQQCGAGEIFINSVDRDGIYRGFAIDLIQEICAAVSVPVTCCGGAGQPAHFQEVFAFTNVSAAAAGNFFHFTEHSVATLKAQLERNVPLRHEVHADYRDSQFDTQGRLVKKSDELLENMLFEKIDHEVI
jgi:imidazole glycerol-phosphate synthase subunit HisF